MGFVQLANHTIRLQHFAVKLADWQSCVGLPPPSLQPSRPGNDPMDDARAYSSAYSALATCTSLLFVAADGN